LIGIPIIEQILKAFSMRLNFGKLMSTKANQELSCISGLRVITIVWVVVSDSMDFLNILIIILEKLITK
jgi:hypothetical protein